MATKNENAKVGIIDKKRQPTKPKTLTSVIEKREKKQDGAGEAGVDPQLGTLNTMPDPNEFPKEPSTKKGKK
ncbi:MAG: hypothetical protein ACRDE7_07405 [Sphingobacterium sp.]